jgi:hypothetical protein
MPLIPVCAGMSGALKDSSRCYRDLMSIDTSAEPDDATHYAFRQSLVGAPSAFILGDTYIEWRSGVRALKIPYSDIKQVRLAFRPVTLQSYRFVAEVKSRTGVKFTIASTSWRSLVEHERHDLHYKAFLTELHRRIAAAGGSVTWVTGAPAFLYWPGLVIFTGLMLATAILAARAVQAGEWQATAFIAVMLGFFLWQTAAFFRRNKPGAYAPDRLPPHVMP